MKRKKGRLQRHKCGWVFHVPMGNRNLATATIIGSSIGVLIEWDGRDENRLGRFSEDAWRLKKTNVNPMCKRVQMARMLTEDIVGPITKAIKVLMSQVWSYHWSNVVGRAGNNCNIQDLGCEGHFTWFNMRKSPNNIQERLDRALDNAEWRNQWYLYMVTTLPRYKSDHNPILLECSISDFGLQMKKKPHLHRFDQLWLEKESDCLQVLKHSCIPSENVSSTK
ncbi:hypothetical protein VNO78_23801 [Psophocarpus tetragonolobus]|uniref:Uncharacterized protein n=1 Tax=Psophocarpus tetragonolobus TaxID=3891 RepID=A0AAN9S549_PSOTE